MEIRKKCKEIIWALIMHSYTNAPNFLLIQYVVYHKIFNNTSVCHHVEKVENHYIIPFRLMT